jgi:hypothetical protein
MSKANQVEVEVEDEVMDVATEEEAQISSVAVMRKEKPQREDVVEDTQRQGMINLKFNATTVRNLATMLRNVDLPKIELRGRPTMWKKRMKSLKRCC